jgi:hypothetical protein
MSPPPEPTHDHEIDDEADGCDIDFAAAEATSDEDLPVTFGGEA